MELKKALTAGAVATTILTLLAVVQATTGLDVFAIPYIASAAVVALAPAAPLARPRALLIGYPAAVVVALVTTTVFGPSLYNATAAVALAIIVMALANAPHVPAIAAAAFVGLNDPGPAYLISMVPAVAIILAVPLLIGRRYGYALSWT